MHTDLGAPLRYETHYEGRCCVEVADLIGGIGMAAIRVVQYLPGWECKTLWSEQIEVQMEPGYPVQHLRHDGRSVCYGGPSHPFYSMAQKRAADLLQGRLEEARGVALSYSGEEA